MENGSACPHFPTMTMAKVLETTRIHRATSCTGDRMALGTALPFRAPHHAISDVRVIGSCHDLMFDLGWCDSAPPGQHAVAHVYARSNSKTSEPSTATISRATTSLTAAPSPSLRDTLFSVTPPLATCTQA
jgi:Magnesium chelatase, subunit ChlI